MSNNILTSLVDSVLGSGKSTSKGNRAYVCPFHTSNPPGKKNLEINLNITEKNENPWHCWGCDARGKTLNSLFKKLKVNSEKLSELKFIIKTSPKDYKEFATPKNISLPKEFIDVVGTNVNDYRAFTKQVKDGLAQPVIAEALKLTHTVGGSFLEHYNTVGAQMYAGKQQQQSQAPQQKPVPATQQRQVNPREQELRSKAGAGGGGDNTSKKASDLSVDDIWNMSASELMDMDFRDAE